MTKHEELINQIKAAWVYEFHGPANYEAAEKEFDDLLADIWDDGEGNVYMGRYDQYDTGSLMTHGPNPYRRTD